MLASNKSLSSNELPFKAEFSPAKDLNSAQNPSNKDIKVQNLSNKGVKSQNSANKTLLLVQNSSESSTLGKLLGSTDSTQNSSEDSAQSSNQGKISTYELGAVEITAPKQPDANPTVVTINKNEMDRTASLDVGQAIRNTPGVFNASITTGTQALFIRGFDERYIGYHLDGIPVNDIYTGNAAAATDLFPFFTFGLSSVQISKGYISPTLSTGKLGGAINMVTSVPVKDLEVNLGYRFIANNEHRINAQVGRNLGDRYFQITFSSIDRKNLHYSYDHSGEGPVDITYHGNFGGYDTSRYAYMISGKYGWIIGDNHEYSANFYYQHEKMRGTQTNPNFNFHNYDKMGFYVLGDSKFTDLFSLNSKLWYNTNKNVGEFFNNGQGSKYDDYSLGLTETLKFDFSEDQNLKVGAIVKNDSHEATDFTATGTAEYLTRDWQILNSSLFAEYALRANDVFRFVLSASWERHDGLSIKNYQGASNAVRTGASKSKNKHINGWNLQGIAYVQPVESLLLHANVGHKSQIPKIRFLYDNSGDVYGDEGLDAESIIGTELGADFENKIE